MTRADLSVCICVSKRKRTSGSTVLIVFLAPRLLQASQRECVSEGKRCVRLYLESLQTPSSPLSSPLSVLSARRICQFSFSLFVPALIPLSEPWLASLTAAEHRSYSFSANNTHSGTPGTIARSHTLALRYSAHPPPPPSLRALQNKKKSVTTGSAIV